MTIAYLYAKFVKKILRGKCVAGSKVHPTVVINSGCSIVYSNIGKYSYVGYDSELVACSVGAYCSIANDVKIGGAEHPIEWLSTSPVFQDVKHSGPTMRYAEHKLPPVKETKIGNDVWIGQMAIIKQGVIIGNGAVVGAGAVVTKNVEPYSIVAGCPAKLIKYRFDAETIDALEKLQWWNMSGDRLKELGMYATDVKEFIKKARE